MGDSHKKCPKTVLLIQMIVIYSFIDQFLKFLNISLFSRDFR